MLQSVEIVDGVASRRGVQHEAASGVRVPNLGERRFVGAAAEGIQRRRAERQQAIGGRGVPQYLH